MKHSLLLGLAAALLSACAGAPKPSSENLTAIASGEKGAILAALDGPRCYTATVFFENIDTKETVSAKGLGYAWSKSVEAGSKKVGVIAVPPGTYKFKGGNCSDITSAASSKSRFYPSAEHWFDPFIVGPGEAVYAGTLVPREVKFKFAEGYGDAVSTGLSSPHHDLTINGVGGSTGPRFNLRNASAKYNVFELKDRSDSVIERLKEKQPEVVANFVTRLPRTRLDRGTVQQIVKDSHEAEEKATTDAARQAEIDKRVKYAAIVKVRYNQNSASDLLNQNRNWP